MRGLMRCREKSRARLISAQVVQSDGRTDEQMVRGRGAGRGRRGDVAHSAEGEAQLVHQVTDGEQRLDGRAPCPLHVHLILGRQMSQCSAAEEASLCPWPLAVQTLRRTFAPLVSGRCFHADAVRTPGFHAAVPPLPLPRVGQPTGGQAVPPSRTLDTVYGLDWARWERPANAQTSEQRACLVREVLKILLEGTQGTLEPFAQLHQPPVCLEDGRRRARAHRKRGAQSSRAKSQRSRRMTNFERHQHPGPFLDALQRAELAPRLCKVHQDARPRATLSAAALDPVARNAPSDGTVEETSQQSGVSGAAVCDGLRLHSEFVCTGSTAQSGLKWRQPSLQLWVVGQGLLELHGTLGRMNERHCRKDGAARPFGEFGAEAIFEGALRSHDD